MKIKTIIRNSKWGGVLLNSRFYVLLRDKKRIEKVLASFDMSYDGALLKDMVDEYRLHRVPYDEYLLFGFHQVEDSAKRRQFVTDMERINYANRLNRKENDLIFYDKGKTYETFHHFYRRDVLRITQDSDVGIFKSFLDKHGTFICKPIDGGCGVGIKIISFRRKTETAEQLFEMLNTVYGNKCIIEELIVQDKKINELHHSSVNTVRIPTIRFDDRVEIIHPFLRVGKGNSITDNAGSGGIICAIDVETGTIFATADEFGKTYDVHPDTGIPLIGFTIPRWEEAKNMVKTMALIVPSNRYCSWDMALTSSGWEMVEVNAKGQFVWQYATKSGFREEIEDIMREIGC